MEGKLITDTEKSQKLSGIEQGLWTSFGGKWVDQLKRSTNEYGEDVDKINSRMLSSVEKSDADMLGMLNKITVTQTKTAEEISKQQLDSIKSFVSWAKSNIDSSSASAGSVLSNSVNTASNNLITASKNSLTIGNIVSSNFQNAGNAVSIGITSSGQHIAVIGSVARQQFESAGNTLVSSIGSAASSHYNAVGNASNYHVLQLGNAANNHANTINNAASNHAVKLGNAATDHQNKVVNSGSNFASSIDSAGTVFTSSVAKTMAEWAAIGKLTFGNKQISGEGIGWGFSDANPSSTSSNQVNANSGVMNVNGAVNGNFEDIACTGDIVQVNGLKYTSPSGYTSYINPMTYIESGGISRYQTEGQQQISAESIESSLFSYMSDATKTQEVNTKKVEDASKDLATSGTSASTKLTTSSFTLKQATDYTAQVNAAIASNNMQVSASTSAQTTAASNIASNNLISGSTLASSNINTASNIFSSQTIGTSNYASASAYKVSDATYNQLTNAGSNVYGSLNTGSTTFTNAGNVVSTGLNTGATSITTAATAVNTAADKLSSVSNSLSINFGWGSTGGIGIDSGRGASNSAAQAIGTRASATGWGAQLSNMVSAGARSGSIGGFSWGAQGADITSPMALMAGEKGKELLLPSDIRETIMYLNSMGLSRLKSQSGPVISIPYTKQESIFNNGNNNVSGSEIRDSLMATLILEIDGQKFVEKIMPLTMRKASRYGMKLKG
jgi:hypothetical protein